MAKGSSRVRCASRPVARRADAPGAQASTRAEPGPPRCHSPGSGLLQAAARIGVMIGAERPMMPSRLISENLRSASRSSGGNSAWAIVLAGGEGTRLRPLVERIHADGRPKQYAVLVGSRSLLRQTLDRVALAVPPERTLVVRRGPTRGSSPPSSPAPGAPKVLVQPEDRGTAAGSCYPPSGSPGGTPGRRSRSFRPTTTSRTTRSSCATSFPSGRWWSATPGESCSRGGAGLGGNRLWLDRTGAPRDEATSGELRAVGRFVEKPSLTEARACLARGGLWNTFVMVCRARTILEAGRRALPDLTARLARIRPSAETPAEARAIENAYRRASTADFSRGSVSPPRRASRSPAAPGRVERLGNAGARPPDPAPHGSFATVAARARHDGVSLGDSPGRTIVPRRRQHRCSECLGPNRRRAFRDFFFLDSASRGAYDPRQVQVERYARSDLEVDHEVEARRARDGVGGRGLAGFTDVEHACDADGVASGGVEYGSEGALRRPREGVLAFY